MIEIAKYIWCALAHRKYRYRVGDITYRKVLAFYDVKCIKCGVEDRQSFRWRHPRF